jgi:hypothetical protein
MIESIIEIKSIIISTIKQSLSKRNFSGKTNQKIVFQCLDKIWRSNDLFRKEDLSIISEKCNHLVSKSSSSSSSLASRITADCVIPIVEQEFEHVRLSFVSVLFHLFDLSFVFLFILFFDLYGFLTLFSQIYRTRAIGEQET